MKRHKRGINDKKKSKKNVWYDSEMGCEPQNATSVEGKSASGQGEAPEVINHPDDLGSRSTSRQKWADRNFKVFNSLQEKSDSISSEDGTSENDCELTTMNDLPSPSSRRSSRMDSLHTIWGQGEIVTKLNFMLLKDEENYDLQCAVDEEDLDKVVNICKNGINFEGKKAALLLSAWHGNAKLVKMFLDEGVDPNVRDEEGRMPLHLAACNAAHDCMKLLIKYGADVNSWDYHMKATPLYCAVIPGDIECIKVLLNNGADINAGLQKTGNSALHWAVRVNATECVKLLLEEGAIVNSVQMYSETPLHIASAQGFDECVKLLLKHGADVSLMTLKGNAKMTAMHLAAEDGNVECIKQLLLANADYNCQNHRGQTPLHLAALSQSSETVEYLLRAGANPNIQDSDGRAPLHSAIVKGSRSFECIKLLLERGANVNLQDEFGYSPLHIAALNEFSYCVNLLINFGADVTARTNGGASALSFIVRRTPDVLPKFAEKLDSAISLNDHDINDVDCELKLDFKILVPNSHSKGESSLFMNLIEVGQKQLLKHPLCESFLHLKWLKVRKFFLISVLFHAIFVALYTVFVISVYTQDCHLHYHKPCKQNQSEIHSINEVNMNLKHAEHTGCDHKIYNCLISPAIVVDWSLLLVFTCILICKEILQIIHSLCQYLNHWENWVQWAIIMSVFLISFHHNPVFSRPISMQTSATIDDWQHHCAAIGIFLTWGELMMLMGRFPIFGVYVQMFTKVSQNFAKFLLAYFCLIVAFSLSFSVLFPQYKPFQDMPGNIIKTLVMMVGELEYEDIFYKTENNAYYHITAHFVFTVFLLLVAIILMNLLVGLAVSDIQGLQKSAGLDRLVRQAELISHIESMVFSRLLHCLPKKFLTTLHQKALLIPYAYSWAIYIRPNDQRDKRIPREIVENASKLVFNRYRKRRVLSKTVSSYSTYSCSVDTGLLEERLDQLEYLKTQLNVLVADNSLHETTLTQLQGHIENTISKVTGMQEQIACVQVAVGQLQSMVKNLVMQNKPSENTKHSPECTHEFQLNEEQDN